MSASLGQLIYTRRSGLKFSLKDLSVEMGGSPTESYLWRIEQGGNVSPSIGVQLAHALRLPEDILLNAAGHVTGRQRQTALGRLMELIGEPAPVDVALPVLDVETGEETRERSVHTLRNREPGFVVRLSGQPDPLFDGECVIASSRQPALGQGVVIRRNGRLSAATFRGDHVLRGAERLDGDYEILGPIIRVVSQRDFE